MVKVFGNARLAGPVVSSLADLRVAKVGNDSSPFELLESCPWPRRSRVRRSGLPPQRPLRVGHDTFDCSLTID
jgi:hypothetical protein